MLSKVRWCWSSEAKASSDTPRKEKRSKPRIGRRQSTSRSMGSRQSESQDGEATSRELGEDETWEDVVKEFVLPELKVLLPFFGVSDSKIDLNSKKDLLRTIRAHDKKYADREELKDDRRAILIVHIRRR